MISNICKFSDIKTLIRSISFDFKFDFERIELKRKKTYKMMKVRRSVWIVVIRDHGGVAANT